MIRRPERIGLYDPAFEHESCGVGFVAHIKGKKSHSILNDASKALQSMDHRGAVGAEENTGDGAGILTALPDRFFRRVITEQCGETLPPAGTFGAGIVFLPRDPAERKSVVT